MKTSVLLVLTVFCGSQSEPTLRELLEKLGTSSVEEREQATAKLLQLDSRCIPELEKAAKEHPDVEVRSRIRGIFEELERRKRIEILRPKAMRLTIDLQDLSVAEAAKRLFGPFGVKELPKPPESEPRKLSIGLNRATFWETYDAFFAGWKAKPDMGSSIVEFVDAGDKDPGFAKADFGDLRIAAIPGLGMQIGGETFSELDVEALLPPGYFASSCEFEGVEVFDDKGNKVEARYSIWKDGRDRGAGEIVRAGNWWARFNPDHLKHAKSLEVRGTVILGLPRDLRRFEIDLREAKLPMTRECGGFTLVVSEITPKKTGQWELQWKVVAGREQPEGVLSMEDSHRRWLKDFYRVHRLRLIEVPYTHDGDRPEWLVLTRLIGEEQVRYPFVVKEVPVPPRPSFK